MNQFNALRTAYNTPFIEQRADPYIRYIEGKWYFTASVPEYDRIILRCANSVEALRTAPERVLWRKHDSGVMSRNVWAPEIHCLNGDFYIYFAAGEMDDMWNIRPWVLRCEGGDPMTGDWVECGMLERADGDVFSFTDFSLDMTVFTQQGRNYCIWAEKVSVGRKISNLYIAEMETPLRLKTPQMLLTSPTYAWERHEFWVNEAPTVLEHEGKTFMTYSASDTSPAYCMGMLFKDADADPMDISVWHKMNHPVFASDAQKGIYGPGHNTLFIDEKGGVYSSYHARTYDEIIGDPLYDPNRHAYIMKVPFENGFPVFSLSNQLYQD